MIGLSWSWCQSDTRAAQAADSPSEKLLFTRSHSSSDDAYTCETWSGPQQSPIALIDSMRLSPFIFVVRTTDSPLHRPVLGAT